MNPIQHVEPGAAVAQLVERLICNQQVGSSILSGGSSAPPNRYKPTGLASLMPTDRIFCRFTRSAAPFSIHELPAEDICLSTFLIFSPPGDPKQVLVGRMNPEAPWDHLAGLATNEVEINQDRWVLPASHLLFGEGPNRAATRILHEQLGNLSATWDPPILDSQLYVPHGQRTKHWDLQFIYRGRLASSRLPSLRPWSKLRLVDLSEAKASEFGRSHEDVLTSLGLPV